MKNRLKNKLKAKKTLGNNGHSFRRDDPWKKEYPMPKQYNENLKIFTEMLDEREQYKRSIDFLPPEKKPKAFEIFREYDRSLNDLEQLLANEYESYQKSKAADARKDKAGARLFEHLQRLFIVAKHRFEPQEFADFEKRTLRTMNPAAKKEFYELVAHRESYDLENILADPDGSVKRPPKHPQMQLIEALFDIDRIAYVTSQDFKKLEIEYEKVIAMRDDLEADIWLMNPEHRPQRRTDIERLDKMIDEMKPKLIDFLKMCFDEDGKVEAKKYDQKKLDAAFDRAEIASDRLHLVSKHLIPSLYEKFQANAFATMTPEEIEETQQRIAKREAEELDEILASAGGKREETAEIEAEKVESTTSRKKNDEEKMKIVRNK